MKDSRQLTRMKRLNKLFGTNFRKLLADRAAKGSKKSDANV